MLYDFVFYMYTNYRMTIYIHNPAHNGDVFISSEIVKILVRSNPHTKFKIVPSCSSILFEELVNDNVEICSHPKSWLIDKEYHNDEANRSTDLGHINRLQHTLLSVVNDNLYLNMWMFMTFQYVNCMNITGKHITMKNMLEEIRKDYSIELHFDCNDWRELIPSIPYRDTSFMNTFIDKNKKPILFFNMNGYSGQDENLYSCNFNNNFIQYLLNENPDSQIIIIDECEIKHPNLISLSTDVNIQKSLSGDNLVLYAHICRLCHSVYFKLNGGSFFLLNKDNINDKSTQYYLFYDDYGENFYAHSIINVFNNDIKLLTDFRKHN